MTADVWTDRPVKAGEHNRNGLERIFDSFLQTLEHRGCPQDILTMARVQKTEAIRFACMTPVGEKHVPFIGPVIRPPYLDYHQLMTLCRNGDRDEDGYTSFESADISDATEAPGQPYHWFNAPEKPYYIFDVEDGTATLGMNPDKAIDVFRSQRRSPLTAGEIIALSIHTDILSRQNVWAAGSCVDNLVGLIPTLRLWFHKPYLSADMSSDDDTGDTSYPDYGIPSCIARVCFL